MVCGYEWHGSRWNIQLSEVWTQQWKYSIFSFLLYLCITTGISDNFREAFLKRITLFIELQVQHIIYFQTQLCSFIIVNVFSLFVQNMGTSPQSLALRVSISIASADPSSKKNWIICFHRLLNHQCIAKLITGVELKEGPSVSMISL